MKKYHIHLYKTTKMAEINIEAKDPTDAEDRALEKIKELKFKRSDCKTIARYRGTIKCK